MLNISSRYFAIIFCGILAPLNSHADQLGSMFDSLFYDENTVSSEYTNKQHAETLNQNRADEILSDIKGEYELEELLIKDSGQVVLTQDDLGVTAGTLELTSTNLFIMSLTIQEKTSALAASYFQSINALFTTTFEKKSKFTFTYIRDEIYLTLVERITARRTDTYKWRIKDSSIPSAGENLNINIPELLYSTKSGTQSLWAKLIFSHEDQGKLFWVLGGYGFNGNR